MDSHDVKKLTEQFEHMIVKTRRFADEFADLTDEQLNELADELMLAAEEADGKRRAAEAELHLRALRAVLLPLPKPVQPAPNPET